MTTGGRSTEAALREPVKLPCHAIYVHWGFSSPHAWVYWDVTISRDPGGSVGEYLALFNGSIDGSACYLGLQTDVSHPGLGRGVGKGLIFSTWWTFDAADTRVAEGGFRELGTHEGKFVGVRRQYPWTVGNYRVTLARSGPQIVAGRALDWFDLWVTSLPGGENELIGGLRFPRREPNQPAMIDPGGLLFFEVYGGATTWADVAPWHSEVMAYGEGVRCPRGRTEYPRYPFGQEMPNANARFDPSSGRVQVQAGAGVTRQDQAERWP
jgi:hypothetical protein